MRKLYLIAYGDKLKRDDLTSFLGGVKECERWFYSMPNSLFVISSLTANEVYDRIEERFSVHGRFFVTEVPRHNSQGWIPNNHWEIIKANSVAHDYELEFDGYWLEGKEALLPSKPGLYCVYASTYNRSADTVTLREVLYVGKSVDVRNRHEDHEGKPSWRQKLKEGEVLSYSFAPLPERSLSICEAALIFKLQPVCNDMGKEAFHHESTHIVTKGRNACLPTEFTVTHS